MIFGVEKVFRSHCWASLVAQRLKHLPAIWETQVWSLGQEDPLEKEMATHSSILAGESHGWRSLVGYSPWGRRVGHDWVTSLVTCWYREVREKHYLRQPANYFGVVYVGLAVWYLAFPSRNSILSVYPKLNRPKGVTTVTKLIQDWCTNQGINSFTYNAKYNFQYIFSIGNIFEKPNYNH